MSPGSQNLIYREYKKFQGQAWWHMPLIAGLKRQKQADLWEFKASLGHIESPFLKNIFFQTPPIIWRKWLSNGVDGDEFVSWIGITF